MQRHGETEIEERKGASSIQNRDRTGLERKLKETEKGERHREREKRMETDKTTQRET